MGQLNLSVRSQRCAAAVQAYGAAIARVIKKKKGSAGGAHVVDLGTGSGLLAMMAATAGADSVVACDLHESLCNVARQVTQCDAACVR